MNRKTRAPSPDADACITPYLLPEHVHLCVSGDQVVMLDLIKDHYLAVDASQARSLARMVPGWPVPETQARGSASPVDRVEAAAVAQAMSARGLLTTDRQRGKSAVPVQIAVPSESLQDDQVDTRLTLRWRHIGAFVAAAATAAARLRWTPIAGIVSNVKRQRNGHVGAATAFDTETAKALVDVFYRLRPFFFTADNACLFDSLALIHFLARFGMFPRWIFGVQTAPFAAHCWVQHGDTVLNDSVEHVRRYTPIMAA